MELEKLEKEDRGKARQHEISLRRIDQNLPEPVQNDGFRLSAAIEFVPPFDDVDMTQFLNAFKKAMSIHDFSREKWTQLIHTKLMVRLKKSSHSLVLMRA